MKATLFTLLVSCQTLLAQHPTNGMVEYFTFDNTLTGQMGNSLTSQRANFVEDRFGNPNGAYFINVTNNTIQESVVLGMPQGNNPRTVFMWFKHNSNITHSLFNYGYGNNTFALAYENTSFLVMNYVDHYFTPTTYDTLWHNVAVIHRGATTELYYDCVLIRTISNITFYNNDERMRIGRSPHNVPYLGFKVDDLYIYSRALSHSELLQLCNRTVNTESTKPQTISVYPNPNQGEVIVDHDNISGEYQIVDILGRQISSGHLSHSQTQLSINNYKGVCFLLIKDMCERQFVEKIFVE